MFCQPVKVCYFSGCLFDWYLCGDTSYHKLPDFFQNVPGSVFFRVERHTGWSRNTFQYLPLDTVDLLLYAAAFIV